MTSSDRKVAIGVSMRITQAADYHESRDSLAQDWGRFLKRFDDVLRWMPLPNLGTRISRYVSDWGLSGLILSGGGDFGKSPLRDQSELALIEMALEQGIPVLGVCRGMQFMANYFGGHLVQIEGHVATRHDITFVADAPKPLKGRRINVNSYHTTGLLAAEQLPPELSVLAVDQEGHVEAFRHCHKRFWGIMWHPEREAELSSADVAILSHVFGLAP